MAGKHAILAPSAAHRWTRCPGSVAMCKGITDESTVDAASGTLTHHMAEQTLKDFRPLEDWLGFPASIDSHHFTIDQERIDRARIYVEAINREPGTKMFEVRLDISKALGVPDQSGTGDTIVANVEAREIGVHDLKDGFHKVVAKDNEQLLLYAAGALDALDLVCDWEKVSVHIHQPKIEHYDVHVYTVAEVRSAVSAMVEPARVAMRLFESGSTDEIRAALTPGTVQCTWCPARADCPARHASVIEAFGPAIERELPTVSDREIADALAGIERLEGFCRDLRGEALRRALAGRELLGFKLVRGKKGARYWSDPKLAELNLVMMLGEDVAYEPRAIISPTAAEKALKKDRFDSFRAIVGQAEGSLSLAPVDDRRDAVEIKAVSAEDFGAPV